MSSTTRHHTLRRVGRVVLVVLAALLVPGVAAALAIPRSAASVYPAPGPRSLPAPDRPAAPTIDPAKRTVVIVLGEEGGNAADTLPPYEVFARAGQFNVLTVAPSAGPVPLTGGLDLVPDHTFDSLEAALPGPPDVIVVPQIHGSTDAVVDWVRSQHLAGAPIVMSVCVGAEVVADAGLLENRRATSHWLGLIGLRRSHPDVDWVEGRRFVDSGDVVTTAGVLSGIDGTLHVLERLVDADTVRRVRDEVHWGGYEPGGSDVIPTSSPAPPDLAALLSASYRWDRPTTGVLLSDGVGEVELASAFRPYTELSFLSTLQAVTVDGRPIRSSHGLTFVPRSDWATARSTIDRLVVPGEKAAAAKAAADLPGARAAYLHRRGEFAFDGTLRDIATTYDAGTATWVAKSLQYPLPALPDSGRWPWGLTLRFLVLAAAGAGLALLALRLRRPRPHRP